MLNKLPSFSSLYNLPSKVASIILFPKHPLGYLYMLLSSQYHWTYFLPAYVSLTDRLLHREYICLIVLSGCTQVQQSQVQKECFCDDERYKDYLSHLHKQLWIHHSRSSRPVLLLANGQLLICLKIRFCRSKIGTLLPSTGTNI